MDEVRPGGVTVSMTILVIGALGAVMVSVVPTGFGVPARMTLMLLSVLVTAVGILRNRPGRQRPWWLVVAGLSVNLLADLAKLSDQTIVASSYGILVAALTVTGGILLLAGVIDATLGVRGRDLGGTVDVVIITLAGGTVGWQLLIVPVAEQGWAGSGVEVASALQVLLLLAVAGLLVRIAAGLSPRDRRAAQLLVVALAAGTGVYLVDVVGEAGGGIDRFQGWRSGLAVLTYLVVAAAATHPSMRVLTAAQSPLPDRLTSRRMVGVGIALATPPTVLAAGALFDLPTSELTLALAWAALVPASLIRLHLVARTRDEARRELAVTERRLLSLIAHTGDTVLLVEPAGRRFPIRFASPSSSRLLGRDPRALEGQDLVGFVVADDLGTLDEILGGAESVPRSGDVRVRSTDGATSWVEVVVDEHVDDDGAPALVVTLRDITVRKRTELRWAEAALRDQLTDVFNRRGIEGWLETELDAVDRGRVVVLACDLDDFKPVNDHYGHAAGDAVLREVARRLRSVVRDGDVVGRLGGDEFVVVCTEVDDLDAVGRVAERLTAAVSRPFHVDGVEHRVGASVGVAVGAAGLDGPALIERADEALYRAKAEGKGRVVWSSPAVVS